MAPIGPNGEPLPYPQEQAEPVDAVLKRLISEIQSAANADGQVTENERLLIEKLTTLAQQFLANREKEDQQAMGSSPAMNAISRAYGAV